MSATSSVALVLLDGARAGARFEYHERASLVVGRAPDCSIVLPDEAGYDSVSRYHCALDVNPPSLRVRDLGSRNGTWVAGERLDASEAGEERTLVDGDELRLGDARVRVEIRTAAPQQLAGAAARVLRELGSIDRSALVRGTRPAAPAARRDAPAVPGYAVGAKLGAGGMGVVYRASDEATGEAVAIKLVLPELAVEPRAKQTFLREIENLRALDHPNVVRALATGAIDDAFFVVLELCEGGSVEDLRRASGGRLPLDDALEITVQALDGLDHAHHARIERGGWLTASEVSVGLVHRDVKPANLFLVADGARRVTKVADFGLAKAFDAAGMSGHTLSGTVAGTPVFMPRQQVIDFKFAKPEVDVWAAAATLYMLLTGFAPRDFHRARDPWLAVLEDAPVPIRERGIEVPTRLAEVIDAALIDDPELRFKSASDLKRALIDAA